MLSQAALDGSPNLVRVYRESGQYIAARHDREAAAHQAAAAGMVAEITAVAATASQNAETAQAVAATARNAAAEATDHANRAEDFADAARGHAQRARESANQAEESARQAAQSAAVAQQAATRASQSSVSATRSAISARGSANIAFRHARSAESAARAAYQAAKDAGADANAAVAAAHDARKKAIDRANTEIADARAKFEADAKKACEAVPAGPDHDDCINRANRINRMIADPKGESERNVAICNQFKGHSEVAFNNCLKGTYNPALTYLINKAIADAQDEADTEQFWITAGVIVATVALVAVGLYCAEVCTAPMIAGLAGLEAGFLAEAAGAGLLITIGADLATGFAAEALLASRVAALSDAAFLSGIAVRSSLAQLDLRFIGQKAGKCITGLAKARENATVAGNGLCLKEIQYGRWGDELGDLAYLYRRTVGSMNPGINVAVAKLPGWLDPRFGDEYIRAFSGSGLHSERRIIAEIDKQIAEARKLDPNNTALDIKNITELFTERSPCEACAKFLEGQLSPETLVKYGVYYLKETENETQNLLALLRERANGGR
ncbi:nucleic acid/nucleotide deaminase domain-containing protein [Amycolatopsis azurea]|nr:nucleic acid/nucleotide deaminase domain-containing protein [Amycolatopsis azurea]